MKNRAFWYTLAIGFLIAAIFFLVFTPKPEMDAFNRNPREVIKSCQIETAFGGHNKIIRIEKFEEVREINQMLQRAPVYLVGGTTCLATFNFKNGATLRMQVEVSNDCEVFTVRVNDSSPWKDPTPVSFSTKNLPQLRNVLSNIFSDSTFPPPQSLRL